MNSELKLAQDAAIEAGALILKYYKSDYEVKDKSYNNPVTTADYAADSYLKNILMNARPNYGWLSEETVDSPDRLGKKRVWVVDPIDGTKEFVEGVANFVVSVALVEEGEPVVGVLFNPVTKETFTASKGEGAFLNDVLIECSAKKNLHDMTILNSISETKKGLWSAYNNTFGELKAVGSVAYKLGLTSAGYADIFATLRPKNEWDVCAGDCIIREAGGKLIDLNNEQRLYNQKNTLISPGIVAGQKDAVDKTYTILTGKN